MESQPALLGTGQATPGTRQSPPVRSWGLARRFVGQRTGHGLDPGLNLSLSGRWKKDRAVQWLRQQGSRTCAKQGPQNRYVGTESAHAGAKATGAVKKPAHVHAATGCAKEVRTRPPAAAPAKRICTRPLAVDATKRNIHTFARRRLGEIKICTRRLPPSASQSGTCADFYLAKITTCGFLAQALELCHRGSR